MGLVLVNSVVAGIEEKPRMRIAGLLPQSKNSNQLRKLDSIGMSRGGYLVVMACDLRVL
jgi:hypothetical protein